jgi:Tfp pilus assembly protein PilV
MKKVITILVLSIGLTAMAQGKKGHDYTPEQIATIASKKMTLALDLNKDQEAKIYQMNLENSKERKAKMEERKKNKEEGKRKELTSDERFERESKMLDQKIAKMRNLKSILSKEQYEKWEKMQQNRMKKGHNQHKKQGDNDKEHSRKKGNKKDRSEIEE